MSPRSPRTDLLRTNNWGIGLHDPHLEPFWRSGTMNCNRTLVHTASKGRMDMLSERNVGPNQGRTAVEDILRAQALGLWVGITLDFHHGAGQDTDSVVLSGFYDHEPPHRTEGGYWIHEGDVRASIDEVLRWIPTIERLSYVGLLNEPTSRRLDVLVHMAPHFHYFARRAAQLVPDSAFVCPYGRGWTDIAEECGRINPRTWLAVHIIEATLAEAEAKLNQAMTESSLPIFVEELDADNPQDTADLLELVEEVGG